MSALRTASEDYLRMRRALGYKLEIQGWMLRGFVSYLEQVGASTVTIEHAVAWAAQPAEADPTYWSDRLSVARQFARYLQTIDPACEVPPTRLLACRRRRAIPYLYTPEEVSALMHAAGQPMIRRSWLRASTSSQSSRIASPRRIPVTAVRPISVW